MTKNKVKILVCEYLKNEVKSVLDFEEITDIEIITYPPQCCSPKNDLASILKLSEQSNDYDKIFLLSCSSLQKKCSTIKEFQNFHIQQFDRCYYLLGDNKMIDDFITKGSYIITSGWLNSWKNIISHWKFDRKTAQAFFRESCSNILLLDSGIDPNTRVNIKEFADYVDRPYKVIRIGLDYLKCFIVNVILRWRLQNEKNLTKKILDESKKQKSDNFMIFDLLAKQSESVYERDAIRKLFDLFAMLFAPRSIYYLSFGSNYSTKLWSPFSIKEQNRKEIKSRLKLYKKKNKDFNLESGFVLQVKYKNELLGILEIDQLTFPEYRDSYMSLANSIINVCSLSIENARRYEKIDKIQKDLTKTNKKLNYLNTIDGLTKVANRRKYDEFINFEFNRSVRERNPISLIVCDIDYFKAYNDFYGHRLGDECLFTIATALNKFTRRSTDLFARYGGEEFALVMPNTDNPGAKIIAEQLRKNVEALKMEHSHSKVSKYITISVGVISLLPTIANTPNELFDLADKALYKAKNQGRNRVVIGC